MTTHHRFPKLLLSLANLRGGDFGSLEITAIDRERVEFTLGGDYVQLTRAQWAKVRGVIDNLFGIDVDVDVTVTEPDGERIETRIRERVPQPAARRRRGASAASNEPPPSEG